MNKRHWILFVGMLAVSWVGLAWGQDAAVKSGLTPEGVQQWFSINGTMLKFAFGLAIKYIPGLAGVTNHAIGWVGVLSGIVIELLTPGAAHAAAAAPAGALVAGIGDLVMQQFVQQVWAQRLYEIFARPILERFGAKKAVR